MIWHGKTEYQLKTFIKMYESTINTGGSTFKVTHKTEYIKGRPFYNVVNNWMFTTSEFTPESLCDYINNLCTAAECTVVPTLTRNELYNICKPNF